MDSSCLLRSRRRISAPIFVPPGARVRVTLWPSCSRYWYTFSMRVVFPAPSPPSKVIKALMRLNFFYRAYSFNILNALDADENVSFVQGDKSHSLRRAAHHAHIFHVDA